MASNVSIPTGGAYTVAASETTYVLDDTAYISSTGNGIWESSAYHGNTLQIDGAIYAMQNGVFGISAEGTDTTVKVGESGIINATSGIDLDGANASLLNAGLIAGNSMGVFLEGANGKLTNNGSIFGSNEGILIEGTNATIINHGIVQGDHAISVTAADATIINDGTIVGRIAAINADGLDITLGKDSVVSSGNRSLKIDSNTGEIAHIVNNGAVHGTEFGLIAEDGNETIINHGTITGPIALGAGKDVFDNRGGHIKSSLIVGGNGQDVAGGDGNDTYIIDSRITPKELSGQGTDTVKTTISINFGTGVYAYQELENLTLLGKANINGIGNALGNVIKGNTGNNILSGASGTDILTGGAGVDTFVFKTAFGQDSITDFGRGADKINLADFDDVSGFSDLMKHDVTVSGNELIIGSGSDTLTLHDTAKSDLDASDFIF